MLRYAVHKGEAIGHVCLLIVLSIGVFAAINWCAFIRFSALLLSRHSLHFTPSQLHSSIRESITLCVHAGLLPS